MPRAAGPLVALLLATAPLAPAAAEAPPLIPAPSARAVADELSGELAKRNLEFLSRQHRMRGSRGFDTAAEFVAGELRRYGLERVEVVHVAGDGHTFYGTQRARRAWDADFAELWEMAREEAPDAGNRGDGAAPPHWVRARRLASWDGVPLSLAQDSESADVEADLVDVGAGTDEKDYAGKDVKGRIVLVSSQPEAVVPLAVAKLGAAGIVSYVQNQHTAWWGDDATLVRWGHVGSFNDVPTFAFMVSLGTARGLQARLAHGETIRLHATVKAGQHDGAYEIVTGTIPGADPARRDEEITFSCHLDHPRPGANDNASGCATILEVARSLSKLVAEGRLPRPARTLRFVFPPEIEGTLALLSVRPDIWKRTRVAVHLDMVGGGPATKAVFHVTRGPASLPSFVHDVAGALGEFANRETGAFAATGSADWPLVAPEGGKEPLLAELADYTGGSDHDVWNEGSFGVPALYFNDWPDRYIHTTGDVPANIDPSKLLRAGFLAATSALVLADLDAAHADAVRPVLRAASLRRLARLTERRQGLSAEDDAALVRFWSAYEREVYLSLARFVAPSRAAVDLPADDAAFLERWNGMLGTVAAAPAASGDGAIVFARKASPRGPMSVFGYDYLRAHLGGEKYAVLALPQAVEGTYLYEALNLVDGRRTAQAIHDDLGAIYGPQPLASVVEYLRALESIGVLGRASTASR
jgi:aminopeptidase YwaD